MDDNPFREYGSSYFIYLCIAETVYSTLFNPCSNKIMRNTLSGFLYQTIKGKKCYLQASAGPYRENCALGRIQDLGHMFSFYCVSYRFSKLEAILSLHDVKLH